MTLLAVVGVLLLVPMLLGVSRSVTSELEVARRDVVDEVAATARSALEDGDVTQLRAYLARYHDLFGEGVLVLDAGEQVLAAVGPLRLEDPQVQRRVRDFGYNVADFEVPAVRPWSPDTELLSRPVDLGGDVASGAVFLEVDQTAARAEVRRTWTGVTAAALVALAVVAVLVQRGARWVLKPVSALEDAALAVAADRPVPAVVAGGPPELRRLTRAFELMSTTLSTALAQQRDLVSRTSHHLRNPLTAVRLQTDLMAGDQEVDPARMAAVQDGLERLDETIDRLLGLAEAEHHVMAARRQRLSDPAALDADAQRTTGADLRAHLRSRWSGLDGLRSDVVDDLVVAVPRAELQELVDTLLENAVKYAGPDAAVRVSLEGDGDDGQVRLVVEDDGEGLGDDEIVHAGQRFWRSSRHAEQPGTGLGLAIVDAISRAAGGTMEVRRSDLGGLAVDLCLPRTAS
jgi:signal transduction histidine kinase